MPDPSNYADQSAWMEACVPMMIDEGRDQDQAVAACAQMWRDKASPERVRKAYGEMHRAYSRLDVKAIEDEKRIIKGIASTPAVDRVGDVVDPMGALFEIPLALMLDHNHSEKVGHVHFAKPTKNGIPFEASIVKFDEPGEVKNLVDKAWHLVKTKLRSFVSIGFKPLEGGVELMENGGLKFNKWEWLELSLVAIPANREAVILGAKSLDAAVREIKSLDADLLAASGKEQDGSATGAAEAATPARPGASGKSVVTLNRKERAMSKTVAEQIAALEAKRAANEARMAEIMQKAVDEGRSTDEAEREEFDGLEAEVDTLDGDLKRFRKLEKQMQATAKPVDQAKSAEDASAARGGSTVRVTSPKTEPGVRFARLVKCLGIAKGNEDVASRVAEKMYGDQGVVNIFKAAALYGGLSSDTIQKAAVDAGGSSNWGSQLVGDETGVFADFAEFLRPLTILGAFGTNGIPALTTVPFRTPLLAQSTGGDAYWTGEGLGKGLTKFDFTRTTLEPLKAANIAVLTMELIRDSSPSADVLVRNQLAEALADRINIDFIDPGNAGTAGVKPASITNGVSTIASTGASADNIRADVAAVMQPFINADNPPKNGVWIMASSTALQLSLQRTITGAPEFPGVTINGGTFQGLPVIVSEHVTAYPTSPSARYVWLVNASDIYFGDEGGVEVKMSTEASLQMDSAPTVASIESGSPSGAVAASLVSMFQTNSVAFLAERTVNWKLRRSTGVQGLHNVQWL